MSRELQSQHLNSVGVKAGGYDDAVHVRIGVLTLCGQDPETRNWVEAVHADRADCWTCQQEVASGRERS